MLIARGGDDMHNIGVGIYDFESQQVVLKSGVAFMLTSDLKFHPSKGSRPKMNGCSTLSITCCANFLHSNNTTHSVKQNVIVNAPCILHHWSIVTNHNLYQVHIIQSEG